MVKPESPGAIVVGLAALALLWAAWTWLRPAPGGVGVRTGEETGQGKGEAIPRIDLGRIDAGVGPSGAGDIDVFQFGAPPTRVAPRPTPPPVVLAPPTVAMGPEASPVPTPVPAMNVKYIGTVADKKGLKVAVLMTTDRKEVLTGKAGDVVANRLRIVTIGLESVDVQDLGSDRVRRIPLRAN
jgi:hypothetical protein